MANLRRCAVAATATLLLLCGCKDRGEPAGAGSRSGPGGAPSGEAFAVETAAPPAGKVGEEVSARIRVVPKGEYKVNLEYPHKLVLGGPAAQDPKTLGAKDAQKLSKQELVFAPRVKIQAPGEQKLEGELSFSVCTERQCEIKKQKVEWIVEGTE